MVLSSNCLDFSEASGALKEREMRERQLVVLFLNTIQFGNSEMEQSCSELNKGLLHVVLTL